MRNYMEFHLELASCLLFTRGTFGWNRRLLVRLSEVVRVCQDPTGNFVPCETVNT